MRPQFEAHVRIARANGIIAGLVIAREGLGVEFGVAVLGWIVRLRIGK